SHRTASKPMTNSRSKPMNNLDTLQVRAKALQLNGLLTHWTQVATEGWVNSLIDWEEHERARRSLERRLRAARIGRFKPICDFDWNWPKRCDRAAFEALMSLDFLKDATNVVLVGPNGVGKSTLASLSWSRPTFVADDVRMYPIASILRFPLPTMVLTKICNASLGEDLQGTAPGGNGNGQTDEAKLI